MSNSVAPTSPIAARDDTDPGDQMQRNVRYQHAYGVIVLTACIRGDRQYVAIWCEQHEDYLAEWPDGLHDALQIKTKRPEDGAWVWSDDGLRKSIRRFIQLERRFPGRIRNFCFISNVDCHRSTAKGQIRRSPPLLLEAIKAEAALDGELREAVVELCKYCDCTEEELVTVMKRLSFQLGPPRDHMVEVVAHRHVAQCQQCRHMNSVGLDACVDALSQRVARASSLEIRDGKNDFWAIAGSGGQDPYLTAKRVSVESMREVLHQLRGVPFRYAALKAKPKVGAGQDYLSVMEQKLERGGLADYVELMADRMESADRHLMEMQSLLDADRFDEVFNQLLAVVKTQCQEAQLATAVDDGQYGRAMLKEVHRRLEDIAKNRPEMVHGEQYDLLCGIAGLLTGDCKVWWSEKFKLKGEVAA